MSLVPTLRRFVTAGLVAALLGSIPASAEIVEQILVKVNGDIFTKTELEARQATILRQRNQQMTDDELRKQVAAITPQLLVDTVDEMLVLQRGRELGYKMSDEQFTQILGNIKKENKLETDEQFQAALRQEGLTLAELRKSMETRMIIERVQQAEVFGRINVTEPEERQYYEEHPGEFTSPPTITLREILLKVPGDGKTINVGLDEETKTRAEALRAKLAGGADFEKAVTESSDAASKANGGLIGPVNLSELNPALAKVLTPLKAGQVAPVIPVQGGYEIFKVEASTPPSVLPFEQARGQIADKIFNRRRQGEFEKYLQKLRSVAIIEWKNAELHKLYLQRLKEIAAANPATGDAL